MPRVLLHGITKDYSKGHRAVNRLDLAIGKHDPIMRFLRQGVNEQTTRAEAYEQLMEVVQ